MPGKVLTFYSFGGAGRTMALANVAVRLAQLGLRVIAVDMDLEAPALHGFLPGSERSDSPEKKGVIEFFADWRRAIDESALAPPNALDSLYTPTIEHAPGSLRVLLAGRQDSAYGLKLEHLMLEDFYAMDHGGSAVETLRAQLTGDADVVLVDSRAGRTDIGGISTIQLADGILFVALANERCYRGAMSVAQAVMNAPSIERAGREPPTTWLALSRVPDRRIMRPWLKEHEASFDQAVKDGIWTGEHRVGLSSYYLPETSRWAIGEPIVPMVQGPFHANDVDPLAIGYDMLSVRLAAWVDSTRAPAAGVVEAGGSP